MTGARHMGYFTFPSMASLPLDKQINVIRANKGADTENIIKCFRALFRSRPSCKRNVTRPKAAGAL